jgi:hypothetical protein
LVIAVLAEVAANTVTAATASGSPNRLLYLDPVRHMSVISGSSRTRDRALWQLAPSARKGSRCRSGGIFSQVSTA